MELRYSNLHEEFVALYEEVKAANCLQDEEKIQGYPSTLAAWVAKDSFDVVKEKTLQVDKNHKTFLRESNTNFEILKALQDKVADLKQTLQDSLQRTM